MTIHEYLNSLGSTPDEVAATLERQGIRAIPNAVDHCAIVAGIKIHYTGIWAKFIRSKSSGTITYDDGQVIDPRLPRPVADFIRKFDEKGYPSLIHPNREECLYDMEILMEERKLERLKQRREEVRAQG